MGKSKKRFASPLIVNLQTRSRLIGTGGCRSSGQAESALWLAQSCMPSHGMAGRSGFSFVLFVNFCGRRSMVGKRGDSSRLARVVQTGRVGVVRGFAIPPRAAGSYSVAAVPFFGRWRCSLAAVARIGQCLGTPTFSRLRRTQWRLDSATHENGTNWRCNRATWRAAPLTAEFAAAQEAEDSSSIVMATPFFNRHFCGDDSGPWEHGRR